jgi:hypothetical protein
VSELSTRFAWIIPDYSILSGFAGLVAFAINMNYSSWFEKNYHLLGNYGLWLRGGEINTLEPLQFDVRPVRTLVARLSTYRDVADSFTHKLLYQIISRIDGIYPDLAYLPPPRDAVIMDRDGVPWLLGTSSKCAGCDFSVIAFSLSIVQEILNIPVMLEKSGIPLGKRERMARADVPLVILGGASALYTSSMFCDNPLVDGIFIGCDAEIIAKLFQLCRDLMQQGISKQEVLSQLAGVPGFFEPDGKISTTVCNKPLVPGRQLLEDGIILYDRELAGKGSLQLSEGCASFCSFCAEGFSRKPYRELDLHELEDAALRMKACMAIDTLELYSFNFASYRNFYGLIRYLTEYFHSVGLKSQRLDSISHDRGMLDILHAAGKSSMTCAIEGISMRMRRYLHKSIDEQDLKKGMLYLLSAPLRELKIFLIATGLEQEEDFEEFRKLLEYLQTILHSAENHPRIIFSMTILVRFPWTPLEFEDAPSPEICEKMMFRTERLVRNASFEFRASASSADYWISQLLVRAAHTVIGDAMRFVCKDTEFVYYKEFPAGFIAKVKEYFNRAGESADTFFKGIPPPMRHSVPWNNLSTGVAPEFLQQQWSFARSFTDNGYCSGTAGKNGLCSGCNACVDPETKQRILDQPSARGYSAGNFAERIRENASRESAFHFRIIAGEYFRGVPRALRRVALARAMMLADRRLVDAYRRIESDSAYGALFSDWLTGYDSVTLYFDNKWKDLIQKLSIDSAFIKKVNNILGDKEKLTGDCQSCDIPGRFISMESAFPFDPSRFCKSKSLKFTLTKTADNCMHCVFSKEALKKKILSDCFSLKKSDMVEVKIFPGLKFDVEEFARTAFILPQKEDWVRIRMTVDLNYKTE